jgi:NADH-quinone oxidoreductase subunit J
MTGTNIIFYLLAALTLISGLLAVSTRQIFRAAIYLLFSLIGVAGIYFWLDLQFIAAVQIVVYVGGIVVLIIFSIFLTQQAGEKMAKQKIGRKIFSALAVFAGFALTMLQIYQHEFFETSAEPVPVNMKEIGSRMLATRDEGYALPFEVISILLLAAMIGCIVIAIREKKIENNETEGLNVEQGTRNVE